MIYSDLYKEGVRILEDAQIAEAALDARLLLEYICDTNYNTLLAHPDLEVDEVKVSCYIRQVNRRASHIPLQHITGVQEFMGLNFKVSEDVLIPRQDTEYLVEEALIYIQDGMRVLDMCTGSGCILLSIMNYKNDLVGVGIDISDKALKIAKENALNLGLNPALYQGDLYEALASNNEELTSKDKFDVIISNPPYIRTDVIDTLMTEVKDYDPYIALDGGEDGLDFYKKIISGATKYLVRYGHIFLEIGHDQGSDVENLLHENGFIDIKIIKDYSGNDRVATGTYPGSN